MSTRQRVDRLLWEMLAEALDRPCKNEHTIHLDNRIVYLRRYWLNCGGETYAEQSFDISSSSPDDAVMWAKAANQKHLEEKRLRAVYDAVALWLPVGVTS